MYGRGQKNSFLRRREGFTLIELIVVIAIIGILVAIVVPSVAGTKTLSVAAQVDGDGRETQTGVDSYHNRSTARGQWPEQPFGATYPDPAGGSRKFLDENDTEITGFGNSHTELDVNATTTVSDTSGGEKTVTFVPAFLLKAPSSFILDNDDDLVDSEGDPLPEFLWVLKVTSEGSEAEGRLVEVYRLSSTETVDATTVAVYQQVF